MALLQDLIQQIDDPSLRDRILRETDKLVKQKKFGLVFEEHLPECTPLYDVPIRIGSKVARKTGYVSDIYTVLKIDDEEILCDRRETHEQITFQMDELVVVAEFGEPIYPTLKQLDYVENAPDSDLWHTLIEADNYHALQLLEYLYAGKVDCIYIDPPYNTGAKDWKYNNDYVDSSDSYRHSKWLSMMEKRLKLAKKLLNPKDSVLIVTIDEKEYLHLGCLLEELFSEAKMQMISSVINASGVARDNEFYRTDEYIFILRFGQCVPAKVRLSDDWLTARTTGKDKLRWRRIRRQGSDDARVDAPNQFYPIFISKNGKKYIGSGASLPIDALKEDVKVPSNCITVWPLKPNGAEGRWQISQQSLDQLYQEGFIKITWTKKWGYTPQYLAEGEREKVISGQFPILGKDEYGTIITDEAIEEAPFVPGTQWRISSHNAREFGAKILRKIFADKLFDFPKSLYAVYDTIRFFVANKPNALVLDFFAGSGTTLHAINLINADDDGHRRCIMVTNNEVSADEAVALEKRSIKPGDEEWNELGIARNVTWPRTVCCIEGHNVAGQPLNGNYGCKVEKYVEINGEVTDPESGKKVKGKVYKKTKAPTYPELKDIEMASGFKTNAVFFKMSFLDKTSVALGKQFKELIPVLWMKGGAVGKCPVLDTENLPKMLILSENKMAVLIDEIYYPEFDLELKKHPEIQTVFIVTDSESAYREMIRTYDSKDCYQLYRDYLDNFRINTGR